MRARLAVSPAGCGAWGSCASTWWRALPRDATPSATRIDPTLGLFRASIGADGGIVVGEGPLRALLEHERGQALAQGLQRLLGTAWDEALEPLRRGGDGAPVTLLSRTG